MAVLGLASALVSGGAAAAASSPAGAARPAPAVSPAHADHWGYFFGDQIPGDGDVRVRPTAIRLPAPVVQVGSSNSTQYALLANGTVWAWGQGTDGQLGDGGTVNSFTAAVQVQFPAGVKIAFLATDAMPFNTALAVDTKGNAWGWGVDRDGALCLGKSRMYDVPVQLPLTGVSALAGADGHAVYDADGTVYSCGANTDGVLGDGGGHGGGPVRVSGLPAGQVTALVSSWEDAGALLSDGRYYDWGYNDEGQLGNGGTGRSSPVPVLVNLPDSSPVALVAQGGSTPGNGQTLVQLADGATYAWGDDQFSQLGDGRTGVQAIPEQIYPPAGVSYVALASGGDTSYGVTAAGEVYAWGGSAQGEVGDGRKRIARTPVAVDSGATLISSTAGDVTVAGSTSRPVSATALASGGAAVAAVAASNPGGGAVRQAPAVSALQADHWGYFFGDGVKSDLDVQLSPVSIRLPSIVVQLGTSNSTEYALLANGTVWAWGQGTNGQLGDGSTANSFSAPVQVQFPPGVRIAFLATDAMPYDTGLAVDTHGNAWGWGINRSGALCLGDARPHDVPVQLPLTDVTSLAGAAGHAVYDAGGTVYSCGAGTDGVLGDGSTKASMVPARVSGLPAGQVTALVSAFENAGALLADGRYYDWGNNAQGQLGDGITGRPSSVPVPVNLPDASAVTQVAQGGSQAGNGQSLVMLADGALYGWGDDTYGQLGDGHTGTVQPSPRQFYPLPGVTYSTLATGGATSYGISTTGTVYAWGFNGQGEVGNGTRQTARFPVEVDAGAAYISSTAGNVEVAQSDSGIG